MFWTSRLNSTLTGWPRGSRQRGRWGSIEGRFHSQHRWHKAGSCSLGWWQGVAPVQTPPWWGPRSHWNRWHGFYPRRMRLWIPAAKRLINVTWFPSEFYGRSTNCWCMIVGSRLTTGLLHAGRHGAAGQRRCRQEPMLGRRATIPMLGQRARPQRLSPGNKEGRNLTPTFYNLSSSVHLDGLAL